MLVTLRPGGFEGFFDEIDALPRELPPDWRQVASIARKYGVDLVDPGWAAPRG
jgi:hypothetical protein